jgi:membrane-anchored glycerophosphoryl diester phosphodiesterase (GDPDase)
MALIIIGFFLLIIPGFIIAIRLSFVPYLVMDEGLEPIEAIRTSWDMTREFSWDIFGFGIIGFFIGLLGLIFFVIGILPAVMMINASFANYYLSVRDEFEEYSADEEE